MKCLTSTALAKHKVVGSEELTKRTSSNGVHGTRFKIDKDSTGDIFVAGCLNRVLVCNRWRTLPGYVLR